MIRTAIRTATLVAAGLALLASAAPQSQNSAAGSGPYYGGTGYGGSSYGGSGSDWVPPYEASPAPVAQQTYVTVHVVQALVGIKSNNKPWDGAGSISPELIQGLESKLVASGNPYAVAGAVAIEMGTIANSGYDAPDTFGTLQVFTPTGSFDTQIPYIPDTSSPNWNGLTVNHVPLNDPGVRLRVTLTDRDAINNDPIGSAEINSADIAEALAQARIYPVPVYLQGNRQLLFIGISVLPEP